MNIGLSLSGGGIRAVVFHLGALYRLAQEELLEDVIVISTVSGGSLCAGLIYANNGYKWPTSGDFISYLLPIIRGTVTSVNLEREFLWKCGRKIWRLFGHRAHFLASAIEDTWGIEAYLSQIPERPLWMINATTEETGVNWRFASHFMGDWRCGRVRNPILPLSHALAASSAVPVAVGAYEIKTKDHKWEDYVDKQWQPINPKLKQLHLWDGGLYDNLGMEAITNIHTGKYKQEAENVDFYIVSDASVALPYKATDLKEATMRVVYEIPATQGSAMRRRMFVDRLERETSGGRLLHIGRSAQYILAKSKHLSAEQIQVISAACLNDGEIAVATSVGLTIRRLSPIEFDTIFRHGYEVTDCTLHTYMPEKFAHKPFMQ